MDVIEFDPEMTAEKFLALPQATRDAYVESERRRALAAGWIPYWSETAGCTAWRIPEEKVT